MNYFKVFMDIDEQLINQNTENAEADVAGELREARRGGQLAEPSGEMSLREQVQRKKMQESETEENKAADSVSRENPLLRFTDGLLKAAWENLITSWGLTLFYIDLHVFLNKVFGPSAFRNLGEEWLPASIKKFNQEKAKEASALIKVVETNGVGFLNLGCLFLIILIFSIIALIYSAINDTASTLFNILKNGGFSDFFEMIKNLW